MINLHNLKGIVPINKKEMNETNGGWVPYAVTLALYVASEFDSIKKGIQDAVAGKEYDYNPCCS